MKTGNAPIVLPEEQGKLYWYLGGVMNIKLTGAETGGQFSLIDEHLQVASATPYHIHHNEDETFFVVEGETEFVLDGRKIQAKAGSVVFLPKGIPHGFRVIGNGPARVLNLVTPSGFEQLFMEAGDPAPSLELPEPSKPDMARIVAASQKLGLEILGPLDKFVTE